MGLFGKTINDLMEEGVQQSIESNLATIIASQMMKKEFPEKYSNVKENEWNTFHNGTIEIIGNLRIKKDETYFRDIEINGKTKKYKIILRGISISDWKKQQV